MVRADDLDPDNIPWHWVAVNLRVWRLERNLSQADVARICGIDKTAVSNWESGGAKLPQKHAETLDRVWKTRGHFVRLRALAESSHDPNWFNAYTRYELRSDTISAYSALTVHALLQTEDYARALIAGAQIVDDVELAVTTRMARQEIFNRPEPPEVRLYVRQTVLEDPVGGPEIMRAQLAHLLDLSQRRGVVIRALPKANATHAGVDGSFTILQIGQAEYAWSSAVGGGRLVSDPAKVREQRLRYSLIGDDALSRDSTRSLLCELMEAMK